MPVVDLITNNDTIASEHRDKYVVEMRFEHDRESITEELEAVFDGADKATVIEFINFLHAANEVVLDTYSEPDEVEGYEQFCNYSTPAGLNAWPSDHNGNYFGELEDVHVAYYDSNGIRFEVFQKKQ